MKTIDRKALSIILGLVITTVSGISINQSIAGELPNVQIRTLPGILYWGYVLPWLVQTKYFGVSKSVIWQNFIADVFIWSVIVYTVLTIFKLPAVKRKTRKKAKRRTRKVSKRRRR